jgi:hypothetical protein
MDKTSAAENHTHAALFIKAKRLQQPLEPFRSAGHRHHSASSPIG